MAGESSQPECNPQPYDGQVFIVTQQGKNFSSDSQNNPNITNGVISGSKVTFSIVIENSQSRDGCGDFSDLSGTLSGQTVEGVFSGTDCSNFRVWEGTFSAAIDQQP